VDLGLTDKVAVVTGGSKGIGLAVVRTLAAEGAKVVAGARNVQALQDIDGVTGVESDLATADGPAALVSRAVELHGRIDVLVNNVGFAPARVDGFLKSTDEDFAATMELDYFASVRATRAAAKVMVAQGEGTIVNTASVNAFFQPDGAVIDYGAAKAALVNFAKALSQELAPQGVRINSVSPGPVETDLWLGDGGVAKTVGASAGVDPQAVRDEVTAGIPTGRFSTPDEVATIIALLASPRTANVNGSNWVIDGGLVKTT
jgi:NAD(P)-dependent dehydrogenase (short-subunit alcohol dehydrogenase family)